MTVLNTIELTKVSWIPFAIAGGLWASLFITIPLMNKVKNKFVSGVLFIYTVIATLCGAMLILESEEYQVPSGEYHYEITIDDNTSFAEVIEKYNIIEQRGELFVVEEKE